MPLVVALLAGTMSALPARATHGPHASITDVQELEGDAGTTTFQFTISITQAPGALDSWTIDWATAERAAGDGTDATAGSDYLTTGGSETFDVLNPDTSRTVEVTVNGDADVEEDELFEVVISTGDADVVIDDDRGIGAILDDDFVPELSISDATVTEGDSGTTPMQFTVSLSEAIHESVTVDFATQDGSATVADGDYESNAGTLTFDPGQTLKPVTVTVNADADNEAASEFLQVVLSNATNATIGDPTGDGTIVDDDEPPTVEAGPNRSVETETSHLYTAASITAPPGADLTVTWDFGDGTPDEVGSNVRHRFASVGKFTVTVTVSDSKGGSDSDSFTVDAYDTGAVGRLWGDGRAETAIRASEANWPTSQDVLIALADKYPDALAAGPLSAKLDAPLLLSGPSAMSAALERELHRLRAETVWLLGGESSLSPAIEQRLRFLGYQVQRRSGISRFETAAAVAREVGRNFAGEVVVALGEHADPNRAFPDALSAGSLAASPQQLPLLLTRTDDLPAETERALADLDTKKVWIVGGLSSVSSAVEARLRALGYAVERLEGAGRYETSVDVAEEGLSRLSAGPVRVVFATGATFPDGLTGGALAARVEGLLVLVPNGELPTATQQFLADNADRFDVGVILGGSTTLSESVRLELARLMDN